MRGPRGLPPAHPPPRRTGSGLTAQGCLWAYGRGGSLTPCTFFSLVFLGSCCTARAKPALSCSRPAPTPCQSSTFPSAATLSSWKRWLCRGSGSQTTWGTGRGARSLEDTCPASQQGQLSASTRPSPSLPGGKKKGDFLRRPGSHLTHQRADPEGSQVSPGPPKSQQKTRTAGPPWRRPAGPGPGGSLWGKCDSGPRSSEDAGGSWPTADTLVTFPGGGQRVPPPLLRAVEQAPGRQGPAPEEVPPAQPSRPLP